MTGITFTETPKDTCPQCGHVGYAALTDAIPHCEQCGWDQAPFGIGLPIWDKRAHNCDEVRRKYGSDHFCDPQPNPTVTALAKWMRTRKTLAEWEMATDLLATYGRYAEERLTEATGHGLTKGETEHIAYLIGTLRSEAVGK